VGRKKPRSAPQHEEGGVAAMLRRVGDEQISEAASDAIEAEHVIRQTFGDRAGDLIRTLPPKERKPAADELLQRIKDGRTDFDAVSFWLSMRVRRTRHRLEQAANATAGINAAQRSRGGKASSAVRREQWRPWWQWVSSQPFPEGPKFQRDIVAIIQARALGTPNEELERKRNVPANLPVIRGHGEKPPSERSIRQHLFGAK
jgi:hypothetical protein